LFREEEPHRALKDDKQVAEEEENQSSDSSSFNRLQKMQVITTSGDVSKLSLSRQPAQDAKP
jgi:hypothetical protein